MSTILNTLKKLEEEKSVLEKNIDLKGLLSQGQDSIYPQSGKDESRKMGAITGLVIGVVLLGGLTVYLGNGPKTSLPETKPAFVPKPVAPEPTAQKPVLPAKTSPGFPLAHIQDIADTTTTEPMTDPMQDDDFFGPEDALILPVEESPPVRDEPLPEGTEEIREIESLIQSAIQIRKTDTETPDKTAPVKSNISQHIPGLKVKGIIFLNSDNPVNHIFVTTPNEKNRKLRVGETLMTATLEAIEAQKAIFTYQGQRVEKTIGE